MAFASPVERRNPEHAGGERELLGQWLDFHRATLLMKLEGLDDEQLRRPMVPSGLCLLGLVKHLTSVEHGWFAVGFARTGEPHLYDDAPDEDFTIGLDESTEEIVAGYVRVCERSREIVKSADSLDDAAPHPRAGTMDLRWILIHMIEETARHNGHADIIRELIDGTTGD